MAREFRLPDIGEGLTEAEIVQWLVPVGDPVAVDQPVVEVETDKAVVEIPCPFAGVVLHHGAEEGEVVEVGQVLVVVGESGERWPPEEAEAAPIVGTLSGEAEDLTERRPAPAEGNGRRKVQALPVVRKLAKDLGVDLESLEGTGPQGRITREDVLAAAEVQPETQTRPPMAAGTEDATRMEAPSPVAETPAPHQVVPPRPEPGPHEPKQRRSLSRLRRTIAANMSRSWQEIPHVTTFDEVDATRLLAARRALADRHRRRISVDALVVKAVLPALEAFPDFEATLEGEELVYPGSHDVGVALDTPEGLMVGVVRDAGSMTLLELSAAIERLAEGAKDRSLAPEELSGQSFTVSNIGAVGGGHGTPIVPPGTVAILSVGRAVEKPVARDGRVEIAPLMPLSLSYDHRVIDGAVGRRFMRLVMENLEEPALFLAG